MGVNCVLYQYVMKTPWCHATVAFTSFGATLSEIGQLQRINLLRNLWVAAWEGRVCILRSIWG